MKKLLLLGGSKYLLPVIEEAHKLGVYVITSDYLPDNIAHKYSDEYWNVSIVDKEEVLRLAKSAGIDGIMSFATDPGVTVASYVSEKMGLPGVPYEAACILQNKNQFRTFLRDNNFNVPWFEEVSSVEEGLKKKDLIQYPIIVKPVDSAGSKGVSRVDSPEELQDSLEKAFSYSLNHSCILEEFIEKAGQSSDSDSFCINGDLAFFSMNDQFFDEESPNSYTPSAYIWPSSMSVAAQTELRSEVDRLIKLLNIKNSIFNIETRVDKKGTAYIMECSPRGGGNRISELLQYSTNQSLIEQNIRAALNLPLLPMTDPVYEKSWAMVVLHSNKGGLFKELKLDEKVKPLVQEINLWIEPGEEIEPFNGANNTIGTLVLSNDNYAELKEVIQNISTYIEITLESRENDLECI